MKVETKFVVMYYVTYRGEEDEESWHWVLLENGSILARSVVSFESEKVLLEQSVAFLRAEEITFVRGVPPTVEDVPF